MTHHRLSYKAFFFSSENILGETLHCVKRFAVICEEGPAEDLFDKDPALPPPEINNLTAQPSAPGDPIEDEVLMSHCPYQGSGAGG